jgi:AraC-like DNA-binding protein
VRLVKVVRHASPIGRWEFAFGDPDPRLGGCVRGYCGYDETTPGPMRRRELPTSRVVLILDLGPTLRILDLARETPLFAHAGGFVAGLDDAPTLTETPGTMRGVQVDLTPIGARRLFGVPMSQLAGRTVAIEDLLGAAGRELIGRVADARGWAARFAVIDAWLLRRLAREGDPAVEHAWGVLFASGGRAPIASLAKDLGWSHRRLIARFRDQVGMAPKQLARVIRFEGLLEALRHGRGAPRWTELALDHGYYDQAHLIREVRALTGETPTELHARLLPDLGGVAG